MGKRGTEKNSISENGEFFFTMVDRSFETSSKILNIVHFVQKRTFPNKQCNYVKRIQNRNSSAKMDTFFLKPDLLDHVWSPKVTCWVLINRAS